jgi:hypothetical protein
MMMHQSISFYKPNKNVKSETMDQFIPRTKHYRMCWTAGEDHRKKDAASLEGEPDFHPLTAVLHLLRKICNFHSQS